MPTNVTQGRFPLPQSVEEREEAFIVQDATGQPFA